MRGDGGVSAHPSYAELPQQLFWGVLRHLGDVELAQVEVDVHVDGVVHLGLAIEAQAEAIGAEVELAHLGPSIIVVQVEVERGAIHELHAVVAECAPVQYDAAIDQPGVVVVDDLAFEVQLGDVHVGGSGQAVVLVGQRYVAQGEVLEQHVEHHLGGVLGGCVGGYYEIEVRHARRIDAVVEVDARYFDLLDFEVSLDGGHGLERYEHAVEAEQGVEVLLPDAVFYGVGGGAELEPLEFYRGVGEAAQQQQR